MRRELYSVSTTDYALVTSAFTLLGFEPALELDEAELQSRFQRLRTQFHPDRFSQGSALERRLAVQRAADINAAYATLSAPILRAQHYFALHGVSLDEAQTLQDAAFLNQQMELREALDDARDPLSREALRNQVNLLWSQIWRDLLSADFEDVQRIQLGLQRLQFLQRFLQQMDQGHAHNPG